MRTSPGARKKGEVTNTLAWVECFNSYTAVIASFHPHRARDLLAYMALIIRLAKRFPGRCCAFRLEAAVSKAQDFLTETALVASREVLIERLLYAALGTVARVATLAIFQDFGTMSSLSLIPVSFPQAISISPIKIDNLTLQLCAHPDQQKFN